MPPRSGHQRAKNVEYEEDDVYSDDEYYEDGGEAAGDGVFRPRGQIWQTCRLTFFAKA